MHGLRFGILILLTAIISLPAAAADPKKKNNKAAAAKQKKQNKKASRNKMQQTFEKLDKNKDFELTLAELGAAIPRERQTEARKIFNEVQSEVDPDSKFRKSMNITEFQKGYGRFRSLATPPAAAKQKPKPKKQAPKKKPAKKKNKKPQKKK